MSLPNVQVVIGSTDVSSRAFECRVERGRGRELDPPSAGIAEVYLRNSDGYWNPGATGGTVVAPGSPLYVNCDNGTLVDSTLFTGRVRSVDFTYDVSGDATCRVVAEDVIAGLARRTLTNFSHDAISFGSAVRLVLDNVDYINQISTFGTALGLDPIVAAGVTTVAPYGTAESEGVNALEYLTALEASEQGRIYALRQDLFYAVGRYSTPTLSLTFTDDAASTATWPVPYQTLSGRGGGDVLYTRILGFSPTTGSWRSVTAAGTATYGLTSDLSMSNLRCANDDLTDGVLSFLADVYDSPEWRVDEISCRPFAAVAAGSALKVLLEADLNDTVAVEFTPAAGSAVNGQYRVQGVRHTITPGDHVMALQLSVKSFDADDLFVLDSSALDGADVLGY